MGIGKLIEMLSKIDEKRTNKMNIIYTTYNIHHNSIDIYTYAGYFLRIDCNKAEDGLKTTPCSECALNALAIDDLLDICNPSVHRWICSTVLTPFITVFSPRHTQNVLGSILSPNLCNHHMIFPSLPLNV